MGSAYSAMYRRRQSVGFFGSLLNHWTERQEARKFRIIGVYTEHWRLFSGDRDTGRCDKSWYTLLENSRGKRKVRFGCSTSDLKGKNKATIAYATIIQPWLNGDATTTAMQIACDRSRHQIAV